MESFGLINNKPEERESVTDSLNHRAADQGSHVNRPRSPGLSSPPVSMGLQLLRSPGARVSVVCNVC
jgi:hypothetical protein